MLAEYARCNLHLRGGVCASIPSVAVAAWEPIKALLAGEAAGREAAKGETKLADSASDFIEYFQCDEIRTLPVCAIDRAQVAMPLVTVSGMALPKSSRAGSPG